MKPKLSLIAFFLLCSAFISASVIQEDPFAALLKKVEEYVKSNPQEKIHLHLDKPYYAVGDDIWFKAYIIDTRTSAPSTLSGVLYVDLIDEQDSVKKQLKLPISYGLSWGDFRLPDSLSEGNYRIRAYTQLMRNLEPKFFFDKRIKIGNSWANKVFVSADYAFETKGNDRHVNATIAFEDKNKKPYIGASVTYDVQLDNKNVMAGQAKTDAKGEIAIGFSNPAKATFGSGKIIATITTANKEKIVKVIPLNALTNEADVQFFPEGGNLVENLPSKIGIKAVGANGLGRKIEGVILDNEGTEITKFLTSRLGMSHVVMSPQPGKRYTAKVRFEDGSEKSFDLPASLQSGYVLSVTNTNPDNIVAKIMISADLLNKGELKLIAQHQGNIYMVSRANTNKQITTASIPRKSLPSGIIQLTLFSPDNQPVSERLVFVNIPSDKIAAVLKSDKDSYSKRQEVKMSLSATANDKPVQGSFSVSVTNTSSISPDLDNESNILTSLLLTSDLAGYVEKPNTYFTDNSLETVQALDNLTLTQGWRRFIWKNLIDNILPALAFKPERTLTISGTITQGKKPLPKARVSLLSSQGGFFMIDTLTDQNGRFVFDELNFPDSTKFVVQARYGKDKKFVEIGIDRVPGQLVTLDKNTGDIEINVNERIQSYLTKSESFFEQQVKKGLLQKSIQLNEVNIVAEKPNPAKFSSNLNGPGKADFVFDTETVENGSSVPMLLRSRVPGIIFKLGVPYLNRTINSDLNALTPMLVILDGVRIDYTVEPDASESTNADILENIPVTEIGSIEVLRSGSYTAMYGQNGGGGVLIITTKYGGKGLYNSYTPGLVTYTPKGYYTARQFYSPKYEAKNQSAGTDFRSTVYWNPQVTTDTQGKGAFSFFTTDEPGEYRVVIEGIEKAGKLARQVYTYRVN